MRNNAKPKSILGSIISLLIILSSFNLLAEGTKQMSPTEDDWVLLQLREGFANYGTGGTVRGINLTILDATEEVYFGFSSLCYSNYRNLSDEPYEFRVVDALGNVVHGPHILNPANFNGTDYNKVVAGPDLGAGGYDVSDPIFNFSPTSPGIYHLEFKLFNLVQDQGIAWWDITVADALGTTLPGRVYSKNWWFRAPTDGNPDIFAQPFEGKVYALTLDGFVHLVDFEGSGFRGLTFALAFNSIGPGNTGDLKVDRKSIAGLSLRDPEFDIFLNDPDPKLYIEGEFGTVTYGPVLTSDAQCDTSGSDICIEYEVDQPGLVEIILDLDGDDKIFTPGTKDKILVDRIGLGAALNGCAPWDLTDGLGEKVDPFMPIPIFIRYSQGEIHFMMNDVEYNNPGFKSSLVHPPGGVADNLIFYDDSQLALIDQDNNLDLDNNAATGTNPPITDLNGCMMPCHNWNRLTNTDRNGYGESNTINSWWIKVSLPFPEFTAVTCQTDTLALTKTVTKIKHAASGADGHYDVTFEIDFVNNSTTFFDSIQIEDDMVANFGAAYINWIDGPNISAKAGTPTLPDAGTLPNFFDGISGLLAPGEAMKVNFTVELNPSASGTLSILENQAIGSTTNEFSNSTSDLSDDLNDPTSDDDPTPVPFPGIRLTKSIVQWPPPPSASSNPNTSDLTFEFLIENTGHVDLTKVRLTDDFQDVFGGAFRQIVGFPTLGRNSTAQVRGEVNKAFTGKNRNIELLNEEAILAPGETLQVFVTAELDLRNPNGQLENTATTFGTPTLTNPLLKSIAKKGAFLPGEVFDGVEVMDAAKAPLLLEICDNGSDDDGDGLTDCDDPDCGIDGDIEVEGDCTKMAVKDADPTWTFQWFVNGNPIAGATAATYVPAVKARTDAS